MSRKAPGDPKEPVVEATMDDLRPVDTSPVLRPVSATITLDDDPVPAPSATQLLDPIQDDVPTDPKVRIPTSLGVPLVLGESRAVPPRKRAPLKADAFESSPMLGTASREDAVVPRGPPPAWQKTSVWTPGLIVLTITGVLMVLVAIYIVLQRWG